MEDKAAKEAAKNKMFAALSRKTGLTAKEVFSSNQICLVSIGFGDSETAEHGCQSVISIVLGEGAIGMT